MKDYRKMLEDIGGYENSMVAVSAGPVREIIDEIEKLRKKEIPPEVLDLLRFMCETWNAIDKFVYENCDGDSLIKYPVIQGTSSQINLSKIGEQQYDKKNIAIAVEWMIDNKEG